MSQCHDIVIIGAGPAGCAAAIACALRGLAPVLLEARRQPRTKLCAGGLPPKVIGALPADTRDTIEARASRIRFTFDGEHAYTLGFERPAVHLVDRARLDQRLCERAVALGTELREGLRVRALRPQPGQVELVTDQGGLSARVVIAADGASGSGARLLGGAGVRVRLEGG